LLGFTGVWIDMEGGANYQAIVRYDILPPMLAAADASSSRQGSVGGGDGYLILARYLYKEVMFFIAGLVAEVKIAGYPANYIEVDVAGRTSVDWDAIRVARIEAGLPICGHQDCKIPFDTDPDRDKRVTKEDVAALIKHAEDEVFDLLKANWSAVERIVNVLCKQDRLTTPELIALIAGPDSAGSESAGSDSSGLDNAGSGSAGLNSASPDSASSASAGPDSVGPDSERKPPRRRPESVHSKPACPNSEASGARGSR
jgi:hypothetical protein